MEKENGSVADRLCVSYSDFNHNEKTGITRACKGGYSQQIWKAYVVRRTSLKLLTYTLSFPHMHAFLCVIYPTVADAAQPQLNDRDSS